MSSNVSPAEVSAAVVESTSRSSVDFPQCSPNGVHPIPMIVTRSRIPCEAITRLLRWTRRLPRAGFAFQK